MSELTKDKYGVLQLVTDYGSFGASDAVKAVPKPGIESEDIQYKAIRKAYTPTAIGGGKGSKYPKSSEVEPITIRQTPEPERDVGYDYGALDMFRIAMGSGLKNNAITQALVGVFDRTSFQPDPTFDSVKYATALRDKGFAGKGMDIDDKAYEALVEARSEAEAKYILDKRQDLAMGDEAQGFNLAGSIIGNAAPSVLLGGIAGYATAATGLTGTAAAVTAGASEVLLESGASLYADSQNRYDASGADAIGAGLFGAGVAFRVARAGSKSVKAVTKATSKADGVVDDVVDDVVDNTTTKPKPSTPQTPPVDIPTTNPIPNTEFKYRVSNANYGGTLYKSKGSNLNVNGIDMSFKGTKGGLDELVEDTPDIPKGFENIDGTPLGGVGGSISPELEAALIQRDMLNTGLTETVDELGAELADTTTIPKDIKSEVESVLETQKEAVQSLGENKPKPDFDDTVEVKPIDTIVDDIQTQKLEDAESKVTKGGTKPKTKPKTETKSEPKTTTKPTTVKPTTKTATKPTTDKTVKDATKQLNTFKKEVAEIERKLASKQAKLEKTYTNPQIAAIKADMKEIRVGLPNLRRKVKYWADKVESLTGVEIVAEDLVVKLASAKKAVSKAKAIVDTLQAKESSASIDKQLAKAESILRDKIKAFDKLNQ
jgi:hypothetical protein